MKILGIDTSGRIASVAVTEGKNLLGELTYQTNLTHSQIILPLVKDLLSKLEISLDDIDCVAVSEGPGSYTGLRIGISAVRGMCFAQNKKCLGVSTLEALANNVKCSSATILAVMKARPSIAYFGVYKSENEKLVQIVEDKLCGYDEIAEYANTIDNGILVGDLADNIKSELFENNNNILVAPPSLKLQRASSLCEIALNNQGKFSTCDKLNARYLQETKAEKDKNFSGGQV
ncbi:MAG: tRNA (adenosine(37)-N6)-threonylcarbamoyltransferase complex dimerization subunit type 1 TsaB [Clostridiales bacterium]|nr:tRNA (adenosine(37)-N6)-threonylcarbamoyltransferase complex dimerization subunit type 1 TsaB [Clostridiales bacterium]